MSGDTMGGFEVCTEASTHLDIAGLYSCQVALSMYIQVLEHMYFVELNLQCMLKSMPSTCERFIFAKASQRTYSLAIHAVH